MTNRPFRVYTHVCLCHQVFPVSAQVRSVCPGAQGDAHRLPLHHPGQGQNHRAEDGDHARRTKAQPQCLLHQLHELRRLVRQLQAEPHGTGEMHASLHVHAFLVLSCELDGMAYSQLSLYIKRVIEERVCSNKKKLLVSVLSTRPGAVLHITERMLHG